MPPVVTARQRTPAITPPAQGKCPECGKGNLVRTFKKRVDKVRVEAAYDCPACAFTSDVIELSRAT